MGDKSNLEVLEEWNEKNQRDGITNAAQVEVRKALALEHLAVAVESIAYEFDKLCVSTSQCDKLMKGFGIALGISCADLVKNIRDKDDE